MRLSGIIWEMKEKRTRNDKCKETVRQFVRATDVWLLVYYTKETLGFNLTDPGKTRERSPIIGLYSPGLSNEPSHDIAYTRACLIMLTTIILLLNVCLQSVPHVLINVE